MKQIKKGKTSKRTEPKPEDFATQAEHEAAAEEYIKSKPVYTILNIFIGAENNVDKIKSDVDGKPPTY